VGGWPTHPIVLPPTPQPPELPDTSTGFYCFAPGQAPCVFVKADDPDTAAYEYAKTYGITVGGTMIVFTESDAYVVTTSSDVGPEQH
jgi:hypothetical protein